MSRILLLSLLICVTSALKADGFNTENRDLIAGKDAPFPEDESTLPETTEGTNGKRPVQQKGKSEKQYTPEVKPMPKAGKDVFPSDDET